MRKVPRTNRTRNSTPSQPIKIIFIIIEFFDEEYDSDGDRVPWCDVIGLEGEQDYDKDEIPEIQVEGVIEDKYVNVRETCPVDTDSENKEAEDPPTLPVDDHISIE